jgi:hypothetical protein
MTQPLEARCDNCKQLRPLFTYEPDHAIHLGANAFTCRWCTRDSQPDLCVRCWSAERLREESHPDLIAEAETWEQICENNQRARIRTNTAA